MLALVAGTQKASRVLEWIGSHPFNGQVDFVEVSWGPAAVHGAAKDSDVSAAPPVFHGHVLRGWDLSVSEDVAAVDLLRHAACN